MKYSAKLANRHIFYKKIRKIYQQMHLLVNILAIC